LSDCRIFGLSTSITFLAVSFALWLYFRFVVSEEVRMVLAQSRLPIFSVVFLIVVSGVFALYLFFNRPKISFRNRSLLFSLGVTPLITLNTQIISGYFPQPNNFEQNVHVLIPVLVLIPFLIKVPASSMRFRLLIGVLMGAIALSLLANYSIVKKLNDDVFDAWVRLRETTDISSIIASQPVLVVIDDIDLSGRVSSLAYAKKTSFPLDYRLTFPGPFAPESLQNYVNIKSYIVKNGLLTEKFERAFQVLDHAYRTLNTDFSLSHIGRRNVFSSINDIDSVQPEDVGDYSIYSSK
jgi:hypothetical protein